MQIKNNYSKKWENEKNTDYGEGIYNGDIGYIYHIDKQGLIQRLEYQWIVKQEATEKDKGMSDVEAYGYLIERTN